MIDSLLKSHAFKLKGRLFTLTVIQLLETRLTAIAEQVEQLTEKAPRLFDNTPVVLDCSAVVHEALDLQAICERLRSYHIIPVAIQGGNSALEGLAQTLGLAVFHSTSQHEKPFLDNKVPQPSVVPEMHHTKLIHTPIRSGQQIVAKGGDLIITSSVSHGAELLADGHIHVYGALRGRALAGLDGNVNARIFCHALDAELVSIAGHYRLSDAITPRHTPCQIFLQDGHIHIESL